MKNLNIHELEDFLYRADRPHADGTADLTSQANGSRTITYQEGEWVMTDNFFGGEPYGGHQVIHCSGEPVWLCAYYGIVLTEEGSTDLVYDFLRFVLRHASPSQPLRGPELFTSHPESVMVYRNAVEGDITQFKLTETIHESGKMVYIANFIGGLVDQRLQGSY